MEESTVNLYNMVTTLPEYVDDISLLQQYQEQVSDNKKELAEVNAKCWRMKRKSVAYSLFIQSLKKCYLNALM